MTNTITRQLSQAICTYETPVSCRTFSWWPFSSSCHARVSLPSKRRTERFRRRSEDSGGAEAVSPESGDAIGAIASKSSGETPPQSESNDSGKTPRSLRCQKSSASEPVFSKTRATAHFAGNDGKRNTRRQPETLRPGRRREMGEGSDEYEIRRDIFG